MFLISDIEAVREAAARGGFITVVAPTARVSLIAVRNSKTTMRVSVAYCAPSDRFDKDIGATVSLTRLLQNQCIIVRIGKSSLWKGICTFMYNNYNVEPNEMDIME